MRAACDASAALDRHQRRRDDSLPTVSVLVGPVGLAAREGRLWAERRGRPVVEVPGPEIGAIAGAWVDRLAAERDLRRDVVARIARRRGVDAGELGARLTRMSRPELARYLDDILPGREVDPVEATCRWLLERSAAGEDVAVPGLAAGLAEALADPGGEPPAVRALTALGELVPPGIGPVLLAARWGGGTGASVRVEDVARSLARLALAQPRLTTILAVDPDTLDAYLRSVPESREKALIRSGGVPVDGLDGDGIGRRLATLPAGPADRDGPIRQLAADGATDGLVGLFVEAARAASWPAGPEADDRARSAAERFLFERLESLPETAGRFELNATLDIPFGPGRSMEVDLLSTSLRLAIEVDGYYHFRDDDAYRRDRRKDVLLQGRGYLVVRILAVDVVRRLEEVLDSILAAVASRRTDPIAPNRDETR